MPVGKRTLLATVGEPTSVAGGDGKFALLLVVTVVGETPKISGVYEVCRACVALGQDGAGMDCVECQGLGWEHWFGDRYDPSRATESLTRVETPGSSLYKAAFRRE